MNEQNPDWRVFWGYPPQNFYFLLQWKTIWAFHIYKVLCKYLFILLLLLLHCSDNFKLYDHICKIEDSLPAIFTVWKYYWYKQTAACELSLDLGELWPSRGAFSFMSGCKSFWGTSLLHAALSFGQDSVLWGDNKSNPWTSSSSLKGLCYFKSFQFSMPHAESTL